MAFIFRNPNPINNLVGDCVIRAISILTDKSWENSYMDVVEQGGMMYDMPSSNEVWGAYLRKIGYTRKVIPNTCPDCYTIKNFCMDNPKGKYLLATGSHVVTVIDGDYYDTWDSGNEIPIYYFTKEDLTSGDLQPGLPTAAIV